MNQSDFKRVKKKFPESPGVYLFRDSQNKVLYVGKANRLLQRVSSYFLDSRLLGVKTKRMVAQADLIDVVNVDNEIEALLLEAELIKRYQPPYNSLGKDDKQFIYITIYKPCLNARKSEAFSKITFSRKIEKGAWQFGPFPQGYTVKSLLRVLRRYLPYRDCSEGKYAKYAKLGHGCLYADLGLCDAPCANQISISDYQRNITRLKRFLKGNHREFLKQLKIELKRASRVRDFEQAREIRDIIYGLEYVAQKFKPASYYFTSPNLSQDQSMLEVSELQSLLGFEQSNSGDFRIECFDISTISGSYSVASMVVYSGGMRHAQYRRFAMHSEGMPNDVGMMKEVLQRRLGHLNATDADESFSKRPQLILVDGGKTQVSAGIEVLKRSKLKIPLIGLAKRYETAVIPIERNNKLHYRLYPLPKGSYVRALLTRIRDEAHRFAISYHQKKRGKINLL